MSTRNIDIDHYGYHVMIDLFTVNLRHAAAAPDDNFRWQCCYIYHLFVPANKRDENCVSFLLN